MACLACEKYEKRITNVFRDEELKEKYEKLVGYQVITDCFICDSCNAKLLEALIFQENCIRVYKKNNPNHQQYTKTPSNQIGNKEEEYYILQTSDEVFTNETQAEHQNQLIDDPFTVYEINDKCKEFHFEEQENQSCSKESKTEGENLQKCVRIEKQSEIDESLMNEEILSLAIEDEQNGSYKIESLDDSLASKKPRKSYTVQHKLKIIKYAEDNSNRDAARKFSLNESTVRCFRRQKEMLEGMNPNKSTKRHGTPYWPELESKLKEWADKQAVRPKMTDVREEAIKISKSLGYENFSGSNTYIFKFMQRNNIETASPRPRKKLKVEQDIEDLPDK